ncbi:MAG TPA: efflux RND transporter permease subunit, partial [Ktedonobacteraceae bacterium]|nr:efflux RND transporter permease subunit [Ktedonobacteraceae bacterium]
MSFLSRISLANRSLVALATIAILLFGAILIPQIKQELYPSIEFPTISVISTYAGAAPSIVEQNITDPLEQSFQGIQGVQQITSYSNEGASIIEIEYNYGTDLNQASQTLTQQINKTQQSLPSGVTPQVQTFSISSLPVMQLAVTSTQNTADLATALNSDVVPVLQGINGVASVNVTGVRNQIVTVTLNLASLQNEGLSVTQVQQSLQANNATLPAGELTNDGQSLSIRVGNTYSSLSDLENVIVGEHIVTTLPPGCSASSTGLGGRSGIVSAGCTPKVTSTPVKLSDIATVQQTLAPSTSLTRTDGKDSIGISITETTDGNTVNISNAVHNDLSSFESKLGNGAKITVVSDQAPTINSAISSLVREGLIGALFAIIVILIFLFSIRSTLVTAISIPLSIIIALIGIWIGNYTLNLFTLGGLTIAIGRVVDDSIVVLENIFRHMNNGEEKRVAIPNAVREVAGAVTASTLTTVCVFLPIAFTGGLVGQVFNPFAVTVTIALLASLFVALTIIPVLAYWFLKAPKNAQGGSEKATFLERGYVPLVRWVTGHRAMTIIVAVVILIGSLALIPRLGTNFFGSQQQNTFSISQTLPVGSSLSATDAAAGKVESMLAGISQIQTYQVTVGGGNGFASLLNGGGGYNTASFAITTDPNADHNTVQQTLQSRLNSLSGAGTLTLSAGGGGGGFNSSSISINVQASDPAVLQQAAQEVLAAVQQVPNTTNVGSNLTNAEPLINVTVDTSKASVHGLTATQVGQLVREVYTGSTVTTVTLNGQQENVTMFLGSPASSVQDMQ